MGDRGINDQVATRVFIKIQSCIEEEMPEEVYSADKPFGETVESCVPCMCAFMCVHVGCVCACVYVYMCVHVCAVSTYVCTCGHAVCVFACVHALHTLACAPGS